MIKILLIVEGELREPSFFNRYSTVRKIDDIEIIPFKQNIKELYRKCKDNIFDDIYPDNIIDILRALDISKLELDKIEQKFTDIYLIFDLDIQNVSSNETIDDYFESIKELSTFFCNSTTIGKLLINYPMMDCIYHTSDPNFENCLEITYAANKSECEKYKEYLCTNKLNFDITKLKGNKFSEFASLNLLRAKKLVCDNISIPTANEYEEELNQHEILDHQISLIKEKKIMCVMNTSVFIDVDLYGKRFYFSTRGERLFTKYMS